MQPRRDEIQAKLKALRDDYSMQLPARVGEIEALWEQLRGGSVDERYQDLHRKIHSMAGSAGTFGLHRLGQAARQLELRLKAVITTGQLPDEHAEKFITEGIVSLRRLSQYQLDEPLGALSNQDDASGKVTSCVYMLEEEADNTLNLNEKLTNFGYEVAYFSDRSELCVALERHRPAALIMDFRSVEVQAACTQWLAEYQATQDRLLPVLFLAPTNDFDLRLAAVRAGGYAYLNQPVDITLLIDRLDAVMSHRFDEPYRVLVVDDDLDLSQHYALVLTQAGVQARVVTDATTILDKLEEFKPDVVLMDLYMPDCNGMELARLIRQTSAFVSMPIVFLSSETDTDTQFSALKTGADDFLTKPIHDRHLISVINSRGQRSRALEGVVSRDSLTGLLKHTKIKEQLLFEVQRASRTGITMGFAMLDIDHFKKVNDTYGHPVGDRVIKGLAMILRQRLRGTDLIGRYGGEEFAVVLPGTDTEGALSVVESIRTTFEALDFQVDGKTFNCTLSAGVVICDRCPDAASLIEQADDALYDAKESGRNRVVMRRLKG